VGNVLDQRADVPPLERYRRQLSLDGFGVEGQERLKDSTALVAGIGGLGGTVALYLAAAGIGRLSLTHQGTLDLPDLNRQILMSPEQVGESRVRCAQDGLKRFNPEVAIDILDGRICEENVRDLVDAADIVISCRYNFEERELLNQACVRLGKPLVEAAMYGMEAYLTTILPGRTHCLRCIYPDFPDWDPMTFPVLGAVSGSLGCLAAVEAIKVLTGVGSPLSGQLLYFDLCDMTFKKFRVTRRPDCAVCGVGDGG
jgi:molybdopterin/thiamine biosynthesis adenylyltransferase